MQPINDLYERNQIMTTQQVTELEPRDSFDHLGEDTARLVFPLAALNGAMRALRTREMEHIAFTDFRTIVTDELIPTLRTRAAEARTDLAAQYSSVQAPVRWSTVAARAINGGVTPFFLEEGGGGVPSHIEGRFDGFDLLDTPEGTCQLYMRAVRGIQVFWAQPTLKNFER